MMFSDAEINDLIEYRLVIDCFQINISHSTPTDEECLSYSGPGEIYFDDNKKLRVKIFDADKKLDNWGLLALAALRSRSNEITESDLFNIHANDSSGNQWISEGLYILPYIRPSRYGTIIDVPLAEIKCTKPHIQNNESAFFDIMIPGTFKVPVNSYTTYLEKQSKLDKLEFNNDELSTKIRCSDSHMGIELERFSGEDHYKFMVSFLEAIAIATGVETYPAYYRISTPSMIVSFISSGSAYRASQTHAVAPIVDLRPGETEPFIEFLTCYIKERTNRHNNMIIYWRRLYNVPKPIGDVAALVLSVNIEGMLKDYFTPSDSADEETLNLIRDSRSRLKAAKFDDRIHARLANLIGNLDKPNARASLKKLKSQGKIEEHHVESWSRLRNSLAHADGSDTGEIAKRKMSRDVQVCFDLFCRLICLCIAYSGRTIDHSSTSDESRYS